MKIPEQRHLERRPDETKKAVRFVMQPSARVIARYRKIMRENKNCHGFQERSPALRRRMLRKATPP